MDEAKEDALPPIEDVPEARRDSAEAIKSPPPTSLLGWMSGALGAIALLSAITLLVPSVRQAVFPGSQKTFVGITNRDSAGSPLNEATSSTPSAAEALIPTQKTLLGHRAYDEAPESDLVTLTADGRIKLRQAAAEKFEDMVAAAANEGVILVPLSGFRSQVDQARIFFQVKEERGESATTRAEVSAPPGYSEHHTGYVLDIGDGERPETDVEPAFEETKAYQWLQRNAVRYGFELSFPPNNPQGVAYEPWHWRFVGDRNSLETFYQESPEQ